MSNAPPDLASIAAQCNETVRAMLIDTDPSRLDPYRRKLRDECPQLVRASGSDEMAARALRYDFFESLMIDPGQEGPYSELVLTLVDTTIDLIDWLGIAREMRRRGGRA